MEKDGGNATTKRFSPDDEDENSPSASAVPVEKDGGNTTTSSNASAVPVEKDGGNATTKWFSPDDDDENSSSASASENDALDDDF